MDKGTTPSTPDNPGSTAHALTGCLGMFPMPRSGPPSSGLQGTSRLPSLHVLWTPTGPLSSGGQEAAP